MNDEIVFCQITSQDILPDTCRELQHSHEPADCFGCGAHSRLCAKCRYHPLVCPEIDLCGHCLRLALDREPGASRDNIIDRAGDQLAYCQIVAREITASMCLASQEPEGCNQCPSPYRLCDVCGQRIVHYPQYGLCLHCACDQYVFPEVLASLPKEGEHEMTTELELANQAVDDTELSIDQPADDKPPMKRRKRQRPPLTKQEFEDLYQQAKAFVLQQQWASTALLARKFQISRSRADRLVRRLDRDKIVGARVSRFGVRPVLEAGHEKPEAPAVSRAVTREPGPHGEAKVGLRARLRRLGVICAVLGEGEFRQLLEDTIIDLEQLDGVPELGAPKTAVGLSIHALRRRSDGELYQAAKELIIEAQNASLKLLTARLHISPQRYLRLLARAEAEGLVGQSPKGPFAKRAILVPSTVKTDPARVSVNSSSRAHRIRSLRLLAAVLGPGETTSLLEHVISDLERLERSLER